MDGGAFIPTFRVFNPFCGKETPRRSVTWTSLEMQLKDVSTLAHPPMNSHTLKWPMNNVPPLLNLLAHLAQKIRLSSSRVADQIGRITTAGVITEFPIRTAASYPSGITTGPDGALWFTEAFANKIGRIRDIRTVNDAQSR
jgi:hypothetical protein